MSNKPSRIKKTTSLDIKKVSLTSLNLDQMSLYFCQFSVKYLNSIKCSNYKNDRICLVGEDHGITFNWWSWLRPILDFYDGFT